MRGLIFGLASIITTTPTIDIYNSGNYNLSSDNAITSYEIVQYDGGNYGEGTQLYAFNVGSYNSQGGDCFQIQLSGYFNTDNNETDITAIPYDLIGSTTQMTSSQLYTELQNLADRSDSHFMREFTSFDSVNEVITFENLNNYSNIYFYLLVPYQLYDTNNNICLDLNNTYLTANSMSFTSDSDPNMSYTIGIRNGYQSGYETGSIEGYQQGANSTYQGVFDIGYNEGYQQGNQDGYNRGYDAAENQNYADGYNEGYSLGHTDGYNSGYNEGANSDLTTNGFRVMLNTIVSYPINFLKTAFNFELFGINISALIMFILSCGIVLWVINKFRK